MVVGLAATECGSRPGIGSPSSETGEGTAAVGVMEDGPSIPARLLALASRLTVRPAPALGSYVPHLPWPWQVIDLTARALRPVPGTCRRTVGRPNATAQLIRASGVPPADGSRRVVLYLPGGAFLACGTNSHGRLVSALSKFADSPVLVVYRLLPTHSVEMALDDCYDAYRWLRRRGYQPEQIVLVGDSAGGSLALALVSDCSARTASSLRRSSRCLPKLVRRRSLTGNIGRSTNRSTISNLICRRH